MEAPIGCKVGRYGRVEAQRAVAGRDLAVRGDFGRAAEIDGMFRATTIMHGAVGAELKTGASDAASRKFLEDCYKRAILASSPRDCFRDRGAGGCGCEPDHGAGDGAGVLREDFRCRHRLAVAVEGRIERVLMTQSRLSSGGLVQLG